MPRSIQQLVQEGKRVAEDWEEGFYLFEFFEFQCMCLCLCVSLCVCLCVCLFLTTLFKGIYETALHYGFEYETPGEQYLILRMMSASLKKGNTWLREDAKVDALLKEEAIAVDPEILKDQIRKTASAFAVDMPLLN